MNLKERYANKTEEQLVRIIESTDEEYTSKARQVALKIIQTRTLHPDSLRALALKIMREKIVEALNNYYPIAGELVLPTSRLLDQEELQKIFEEEYKEWSARKSAIEVDGLKYVWGAVSL